MTAHWPRLLPALLTATLLVIPLPLLAAGSISGIVRNARNQPEPYASVLIHGSPIGAMTDSEGRFRIGAVPAGTYTLRVLKMGFETVERKNIEVKDGDRLEFEFELRETVVGWTREIVVEGQRKFIRKDDSTARQAVGRSDLESLPVDTITEAIALKAGVVSQAGQLHFRGGRSNEVLYHIDGIPVRDPLVERPVDISTSAFEQTEALLGGFDAEYGNAQSGIVNITTREGGDIFSGELSWTTDDFGAPDKTYNNYDRMDLGFGGPLLTSKMNYYVSLQGTFSDGYLNTGETRPQSTLLDFIRTGPRQNNEFRFQGKVTYKPDPNMKLSVERLGTSTDRDQYSHIWSRRGYVATRLDTLDTTGEIVTRHGRFSFAREDSTFVPFDGPAHTPDIHESFSQWKAVWNHTMSPKSFYSLRLSRHVFAREDRVQDKMPWEYDGLYPGPWRNDLDFATHRFFAASGDVPLYRDQESIIWTFKGDLTQRIGRHRLKSGWEGIYNNLRSLTIIEPLALNREGKFGSTRSDYHVFNREGSAFVQDQWEHEGMVMNFGVRLDLFSVGDQFDESEVVSRTRRQWSPRLGFAYPVSDRDVFSFHYGRFSQIPERSSIFEDRGSGVAVRGNPNLQTQTTVSYQSGLQHQFAQSVFGQFWVYFKDIYGLLGTEEVSSGDSPERVEQYVNRDYATAHGFELTLKKNFGHGFGGEISYGWSIATGIASDPEQIRSDDVLYFPISEQPLDWDQRHTFSMTAMLAEMDAWQTTLVWTYGSGFPFTPAKRNVRQADPRLTNSGRLPSSSSLDIQFDRFLSIWNYNVKLFVRSNNLLDARTVDGRLFPGLFPLPPGIRSTDYATYYTETGRAGGAYMGDDQDGDGLEDWIPLNDPRVFREGRNIRVGFGVRF